MEILISIRPRFCELIASGQKTIEFRKSKPKIEPPFTAYIYCTKKKSPSGDLILAKSAEMETLFGKNRIVSINHGFQPNEDISVCGKVMGEFVCDEIKEFHVSNDGMIPLWKDYELKNGRLRMDHVAQYVGLESTGFAWHIKNLVIYDDPKSLQGFGFVRPPQSWCYIRKE